MQTSVVITNKTNDIISVDLEDLAQIFERDYSLIVNRKGSDEAIVGKKDPLLISILTLSISGVGVLVSVLTFWLSTRPKYTVELKQGDLTVKIDNYQDNKSIERLIAEKLNIKSKIEVNIKAN